MKIRKTPDHEVIEVTVRRDYEPYDRLVRRERGGGRSIWTVLFCEKDPHGWKVTAMRCLASCRVHHRKR